MTLKLDDLQKTISTMLQTASGKLADGGAQATEYVAHEFPQFISDIDHVQSMVNKGTISSDEAQSLVDQYKLSMQAVLLTVKGLGIIAVQNAVNAALTVLNQALQQAGNTLKFTL